MKKQRETEEHLIGAQEFLWGIPGEVELKAAFLCVHKSGANKVQSDWQTLYNEFGAAPA